MSDLPSGTVTFLFTDIEDSTLLWERDQLAMAAAVEQHLALLRTAVESHYGVLFKVVGDAVQAAFPTAPDALAAALDAQRALTVEPWSGLPQPPRVRMALHTVAAQPRDGDYLAPGLNRLARLLAAAHGGQVLLSLSAQDLTRDALPPGTRLGDLGEHPLRDLYRPERVFQLLHPDLPADFPPLNTLTSRPNNLPLQPTPFLGREEPVGWLVDALRRDEVRLLTITGPGGVGKTRLALRVAADLLETFPDGVWFVDLSAIDDAALVVPTMGAALGLREGEVTTGRLAASLGSKQVLLVLDNFERVVEATPAVAEVLAQAPMVKVLVTSRTPLHAYGEREYPLSPLPLPDPARLPSLERLTQYEAVRLFIERAQAVKPDFAVDNANAPAVAEICSRLDGLPLAIELAAARVKVLPPQALLKRLEQRLPLLTGGARTAPARQQTMRNAIAWSHDLLDRDEQTVFRRLAVFAGGCTIEAAEAVAGAGETFDLLGIMTALVDESLLRQEEGLEGEPRFRMLETVREFALEQLREHADEEDAIRRAHTRFFADLALAARDDINVGVPETVRRLAVEEDNFRAMLAQLLERGDADTALNVIGHPLVNFWLIAGGRLGEARAWLQRAFANGAAISSATRVWGLNGLAVIALFQGDVATARSAAAECYALAKATDDPVVAVRGPFILSIVEEVEGHPAAAARLTREVVDAARSAGDLGTLAWSLTTLGAAQRDLGDLLAATACLEEALALFRRLGGAWGESNALMNLAGVFRQQAHLGRAAQLHAESLIVRRDAGWLSDAYDDLVGIAEIGRVRGHLEPAARLLGAEETYRTVYGSAGWGGTPLRREQTRQALMKQLGEERFAQAWESGRQLPTEQVIAEALALANELAAGAGSGSPT